MEVCTVRLSNSSIMAFRPSGPDTLTASRGDTPFRTQVLTGLEVGLSHAGAGTGTSRIGMADGYPNCYAWQAYCCSFKVRVGSRDSDDLELNAEETRRIGFDVTSYCS